MKKNYFKKSLSLFLTVLMIMSCWVFIAPEHNHADAVEYTNVADYNTSLLDGISFNTSVTTIWDLNWAYNGDYQDSYEQAAYQNVLYSSDCNTATATTGTVSLKDSSAATISWYHGATTFLYDGTTTPRTGVMLNVQTKGSSYNVRTYSSYPTATGLSLQNTYWYASDTRANFMYVINAPTNTEAITTNGTISSDNCWTVNTSTFFANYLAFTGTMSSTEFYRDITPTWTWIGNQASQGTGTTYTKTATPSNKIYVINWKDLKTAYTTAANLVATVKANPAKYSTRSVADLATICKNLMAAHPNNYVNSSTNNPSGYATAASAAVSALNSFSLEERKYDIQAENLFSFADWYYSKSNTQPGNAYSYTANVDAGTLYIASYASSSEVVTAHSSNSTRNQNMYAIPVEGGKEYTIEWTTSCGSTGSIPSVQTTEVFLFFYDEDNQPFDSWASFSPDGKSSGVNSGTVTAPANAKYMELRFDFNNNSYAGNVTFSNIKVYKAERATEIARTDWLSGLDIRQVYSYNGTVGTIETPTRKGYEFAGWQVDSNFDGTPDFDVTSDNPVQLSWPLYAKWTQKTLDIGYDNLFSLSGLAYSGSATLGGGASGNISFDLDAGTVTIESVSKNTNNECYTSYTSNGFTMDVEPETEYIFTADVDFADNSTDMYGQMFIFCYDADGNAVVGPTNLSNNTVQSSQHIGIYPRAEGTQSIKFKTPAGCYKLRVRMGSTAIGVITTYSNIGVYKLADYENYASSYSKVREPFKYGDTTNLMIPTRSGWAFDGWETEDGTAITSVDGLYESDTVYATWTKLHTVTFVNADGTTLDTATVRDGNALASSDYPVATPVKETDASYSYTFEKWLDVPATITADVTIQPSFTATAHSDFTYVLQTAATCESNAKVQKYCGNCNYDFGVITYNPAEDANAADHAGWIALGHEYVESNILGNVDDTYHAIKCKRYNTCKSTKNVEHNWTQGDTTGANCVTAGTVHWSCPCTATKTTTGVTAPDVHDNTETINKKAATCTDKGYTGDTYCNDCKTTITYGKETDALGHTWTVNNSEDYLKDPATCTTNKVYWKVCSTCGISGADDTTGTPEESRTWTKNNTSLGHNWSDTTTFLKSAADCENDAVYWQECSTCHISAENDTTSTGTTWTDVGSKWNHNFTGAYVSNDNGTHVQKCVNENCTATGNENSCTYGAWTTDNASTHSHTCTACAYTPAAENHDWSAWKAVDTNTADAAGEMTRSCSVCGRVETIACDYESVYTKYTCTTDAYTTYTCKECSHVYVVVATGTATGHKYTGEYKIDADNDKHQQLCANGCGTYGTGTTEGEWAACTFTYETISGEDKHTATCTACGNSEEQNCSGGNATCTAKAVCEKCNTEYGALAPHVYECSDEYLHKATDATCTANETYYYYCAGCKATTEGVGTYEKPDTMLPHTYEGNTWYEGAELAKYATCTANEEYYVYCVDCNASSKGTDKEATFQKADTATDHKWGSLVSNEDGTHTYTCQNTDANTGAACTQTKTESCEDWKMQSGVAPSTCLTEGYTVYECDKCAYTWNADYTPALGHTYEGKTKSIDTVYKRSTQTCTQAETYWYRCDRCDVSAGTEVDKYDDETVLYWTSREAAGHKWDAQVAEEKYFATAATCTAAAKYYVSCSVCNVSSEGTDDEATFRYSAALGHDWATTEDIKYLATPADCVNDATYYYECSRCKESSKDITGATWTNEGSKTGHEMTKTEAVEATCSTAGNVEYYTCSNCNKIFSDENGTTEITKTEIAALGHDWATVAYKAATCEEDGHSLHRACSRCNTKNSDYAVYPATGHNFTGAYYCDTVNNYHSRYCKNVDCTATGIVDADGNQVKYSVEYDGLDFVIAGGEECSFKGEYINKTDENGVHSHALKCVCGNETSAICVDEDPLVVEETCTTDGYTEYTCETCGLVWQVAGDPATGHDYTNAAWTSNGDGTHSRVCDNGCGKTETDNCSTQTPATTCGDKNVCDVCNGEYGNEIPHSFTNYVYDENSATCTADGTKTAVCDKCATATDTVTAEGTKLGHTMTDYVYVITEWKHKPADFNEDIKEPTCQDEGLSISYCVNCAYYDTKFVKATGEHTWDEDNKVYIGGDCSTGVKYKITCKYCDAYKTERYQEEHKYATTVISSATCTEDGTVRKECSVCGIVSIEKGDAALGHSYGAVVVEKQASCSQEGRQYYPCVRCGDKQYETIPMTAHGFDIEGAVEGVDYVMVKAKAATCEESGHSGYKQCLRCPNGATSPEETYAATGHADNNGDGKCDSCSEVLYQTDDGEGVGSCGCICHKTNAFSKFIYKIISFFWKIFGIGRSCECGYVHY